MNAAKFIRRQLDEPYETLLGGEEAHHLLSVAHAHQCTPPGHRISWDDCYATADARPLHHKASFLLDYAGRPLPIADHLTGDERVTVTEAIHLAVWINRKARQLGVDQ
ncbi:hypothetical protein [Streptomyces rimosus]